MGLISCIVVTQEDVHRALGPGWRLSQCSPFRRRGKVSRLQAWLKQKSQHIPASPGAPRKGEMPSDPNGPKASRWTQPWAPAGFTSGPLVLRLPSPEEGPAWTGNGTMEASHLSSWTAYAFAVCSRLLDIPVFRTNSASSDPLMTRLFFKLI